MSKFNEIKRLVRILKRLDKNLVKQVSGVSRDEEKIELLKHSIIAKLKLKALDLENKVNLKVKHCTEDNKGLYYLEHQILKLPTKIKLFSIEYSEEEFKKLFNLINKLGKEVKNV